MEALLHHCGEILTEDMRKKLTLPVECALVALASVAELLLTHGLRLRTPIQTLRVRLYALLERMPLQSLEPMLAALLRELVADVTLADNAQAVITGTQLSALCTALEGSLLGGWIRNSEQVKEAI